MLCLIVNALLLVFSCVLVQITDAGRCVIPPYIRDKWIFDGKPNTKLQIREKHLIYKSPDIGNLHFECIDRDGTIMLLRVVQPKNKAETQGFVCIIMSDLADTGFYTIKRLNEFSEERSQHYVFEPQYLDDVSDPGISNICKGNTNMDMVFIKRKPPGCKFQANMLGKWNTTIPRISSIDVAAETMTFNFAPPINLSMVYLCESKDYRQFVLRYANGTRETGDPFICARIAYIPKYKRFRLRVLQHGTLFYGILKLTAHLKPLHLYMDCEWDRYPLIKFNIYGSH